MEAAILWWCHLLGIYDIYAIQIANGIVGGGSLLFLAYLVFGLAMGAISVFIQISK